MLPSFDAEPIRPEKANSVDQEIFYPEWRCFSCHDSGLIDPRLAKLVMQNYDYWEHKRAACQRCELGDSYSDHKNYDQRFTKKVCDELDTIERREWSQFAKAEQRRLELDRLAKCLTMPGSRGRNANDEREIEIRKQEIELREVREEI